MSRSAIPELHMTYTQASLAACGVLLAYTVGLCVYRLFLHPLRHVPGPKLAAATQWVETYYECFKRPGGQFMWAYQRWHDQYGPIVRIGPDEVHIQDPAFYETLYAQSRHSDKLKKLEHRFNNELSVSSTAEHAFHRVRRAALNPFFSKRRVAQHAPHIQAHMDRLCERVSTEFAGRPDAVLNLTNMWAAFAADIVIGYCLEEPYDFILKPNFRAEFSDALVDLFDPVHFITQFPWLTTLSRLLPERLVCAIYPPMRTVLGFNREMERQIRRAKKVHESAEKQNSNSTAGDAATSSTSSIFTALLDSDLPPAELEVKRLQHEAISVIGGGIETTMYTLMTGSFHIPNSPNCRARLRAELVSAAPDPRVLPGLDALMQLPYLTCVVNESLRFAYGTSVRLPRLSPTPLVYTPTAWTTGQTGPEYVLPLGTVVSMDHYTTSHDPSVFPDPFDFRPERWEGDPRAPDGKPLTRYLFTFGRGTRSCAGMQLGYADIYIALASFFRRFNCELFETGRDAVDVYLDSFVPRPKPGTQGVRVKVLNAL